ncbi:MAG: CAP domain-containing protein [Gaiellaceae bacterium]
MSVFASAATASARGLTSSESSLLSVINAARTSHRLAPLRLDYRLLRVARAHSADMLHRQYFSHGAFPSRVRSSGAAGPVFGEDLAWGPMSASWVVSQWLASPAHRAVLLRPGFRRVGVGAFQGSFSGRPGALVVTADFAGR